VNTIEEIQDALAAIVDGAETEGRDLSDEELGQIEAHEAELATAQARRERTVAARERIQAGRQVATPALHHPPGARPSDTIDVAFTAYLRTGQANADIAELRNAQSEGTSTEGGYLVPEGFRQKLVDKMKAFGGVAQEAEELVTATGNNLPWPTLDDTANTGEVVDEGGTFSGGADLVFGEANLGAYSYMAGGTGGAPLRVSRELVQDSAFDIVGLVTRPSWAADGPHPGLAPGHRQRGEAAAGPGARPDRHRLDRVDVRVRRLRQLGARHRPGLPQPGLRVGDERRQPEDDPQDPGRVEPAAAQGRGRGGAVHGRGRHDDPGLPRGDRPGLLRHRGERDHQLGRVRRPARGLRHSPGQGRRAVGQPVRADGQPADHLLVLGSDGRGAAERRGLHRSDRAQPDMATRKSKAADPEPLVGSGLGRVAYEAYSAAVGGKSVHGEALPTWDDQVEDNPTWPPRGAPRRRP
jgi:hypothetical protein